MKKGTSFNRFRSLATLMIAVLLTVSIGIYRVNAQLAPHPSAPKGTGSMGMGKSSNGTPITQQDLNASRSRQSHNRWVTKNFAGINPNTANKSPLATDPSLTSPSMVDPKRSPSRMSDTDRSKGIPSLLGTTWERKLAPISGTFVTPATNATMWLPNENNPAIGHPDYYAVGNYVNSALPTVAPGPIKGITITSGGYGFQNPIVTISDPTGFGAVVQPTVVAGSITQIKVINGGSSYTYPIVTITDTNGIAGGAIAEVSAYGTLTGGIRKFQDNLAGLCTSTTTIPLVTETRTTFNNTNRVAGSTSVTGAVQTCIPVATPDTTSYPGSDFYRIGVKDYDLKMNADIPLTHLRGYVQLDSNNNPVGPQQYLGPAIIATKGRPVRFLVNNQLTQNLHLPVDKTYMGAGMVMTNGSMATASEKRSDVHLHGGDTPWISDGTPHQWDTPAGGDGQPALVGFSKGYDTVNVPDMVGNGSGRIAAPSLTDGLSTRYYPNNMTSRLMFYHDHSYGITRLNVYDGMAAPYLLANPPEEDDLAAAGVPGSVGTTPDLAHLYPMVIQDKTFVPDDGTTGGQLAAQDPTWDLADYGGAGTLWFPHVYMPNQNVYDVTGASNMGRWDYGPWTWPPQTGLQFPAVKCTSLAYPGQILTCPGTPNPSGTAEAFMDTPVINGVAYPKMTVPPQPFRFKLLSVGNDRTWNLSLFYAETNGNNGPAGVICKAGNSFNPADCTEVSMVPAVPHDPTYASPTDGLPLCSQPTVIPNGWGLASSAIDTTTGNPINGTGLPADCWPTSWPTDGRDGGVPNPRYAGPPIIELGTDGGLLPNPIAIPATPMGYEYNRRVITVLNAYYHSLLLGPAERADFVVDFSTVPSGSVLILYNDGPAPIPGFDSRLDYYTGDPDQSSAGGAPSTQPGYGPNTRTVMQIQVNGTPSANGFNFTKLANALPGLFSKYENPIIVPEPAYLPAANGGASAPTLVNIMDYYIGNQGQVSNLTITNPGAGYNVAPQITISAPTTAGGTTAQATAVISGGISSLALTGSPLGGSGYTAAPTVTIAAPDTVGVTATATATLTPTSVGTLILTNGGGSGYTVAPAVTVSAPPAGATSTATATLTPTSVGRVVITNGGGPYGGDSPTVTFSPPQTPGTNAVGRAIMGTGTKEGTVIGVSFTCTGCTHGSGYIAAPTVTFTFNNPEAAPAQGYTILTPTSVGKLTFSTPGMGGSGYIAAPAVTIAPPQTAGTTAAASATLTPTSVGMLTLTGAGSGYTVPPTVSFSAPQAAGTTAAANATISGSVTALYLTTAGSGYTTGAPVTVSIANPTCTLNGTTCVDALANATLGTLPQRPFIPKSISENFTWDYGRMNAVLGVEVPFTSFFNQTTIPYGYIDPPTELFKDGETQFWRITHNGVDTHFVHFHLFNVQVINRVGWDGSIRPTELNELSWKDVVRMNPLEDIVVALQPKKPAGPGGNTPLPWDLPNSVRPLDVTMPLGTTTANSGVPFLFGDVDPTNEPAVVINSLVNYGWEYVWHCHILGHEENDMMRTMTLSLPPNVVASVSTVPNAINTAASVTVSWVDNSLGATGFTVRRAVVTGGVTGAFSTVYTTNLSLSNLTAFNNSYYNTTISWTDTGVVRGATYVYQVIANNVVGYAQTYAPPTNGYSNYSVDSAPAVSRSVTTN